MENISKFLTAIKEYGMPEHACFQTVDLYEKKQLYKAFDCLRLLASLVTDLDSLPYVHSCNLCNCVPAYDLYVGRMSHFVTVHAHYSAVTV